MRIESCIFCDIVAGKSPSYTVWEDEEHLAFLSIYPNTPGATVVVPKKHVSSYAFDAEDLVLAKLIIAAKKVGLLLDKSFPGVARTALVLEGYGIDHLHAKLFPMHGTGDSSEFKPIKSNVDKFFNNYEGYISSHDFVRADNTSLDEVAKKIRLHNERL